MKELDWRKIINGLNSYELSDTGTPAPEMEKIRRENFTLDDVGDFSKLTTEVYFFVNEQTGKTYSFQNHYLTEYGNITLREAVREAKKELDK